MTHGFNCSSTDSSGFILSYDRVNLEYWDTTHNTTTEIIYKLYIHQGNMGFDWRIVHCIQIY